MRLVRSLLPFLSLSCAVHLASAAAPAPRNSTKLLVTNDDGFSGFFEGRYRTADESGGEIDDTGQLRDGTPIKGVAGLREFLARNDEQFIRQFSRKLLGYALGRSVQPTDTDLLEKMASAIRSYDGRVSAAVVEIVTSRQFTNRRREAVNDLPPP